MIFKLGIKLCYCSRWRQVIVCWSFSIYIPDTRIRRKRLVWHRGYLGLHPRRVSYTFPLSLYCQLPGSKSVVFNIVPAVLLSPLLLNLFCASLCRTNRFSLKRKFKPSSSTTIPAVSTRLAYTSRGRITTFLVYNWRLDNVIWLKGSALKNECHHVKTVDEKSLGEWLLHLTLPLSPVWAEDAPVHYEEFTP